MSGIQTIIDTASKLEFDRRRIVGQSISRSQRIRTSERVAAQPFAITVTPRGSFQYNEYRPLLEEIYQKDRFAETTIQLANNPNLSYLVEYRGELTTSTAETITISTWTTNQVTFTNLPAIGGDITTSTIIFNTGDYIQPANSRYPYIIQAPVQRGSGSLATATTHRSLITSENINVSGQNIRLGTNTTISVVVTDVPNYQIYQKNQMNFTSDFKLLEVII